MVAEFHLLSIRREHVCYGEVTHAANQFQIDDFTLVDLVANV